MQAGPLHAGVRLNKCLPQVQRFQDNFIDLGNVMEDIVCVPYRFLPGEARLHKAISHRYTEHGSAMDIRQFM